MWTYDQSSGRLLHDGRSIGTGYAGDGEGKNNPAMQHVHNVGPLPCGRYKIGKPYNTRTHGPFVLPLAPGPANEMHGRAGFLIHGDSIKVPGTASQGCIILSRPVRVQIWQGGDRDLEVVDSFILNPPLPVEGTDV